LVSISYGIVNYAATKILGTPLYPFLTWNGWGTVVIMFLIAFGNTMLYFFIARLTHWIKGKKHIGTEDRKQSLIVGRSASNANSMA